LNERLGEFGVQAIDKFANTFADFVATGKASFRDFANSVLQDLSRIFARAAFFQALEAVFPGLGQTAKVTGSAKGNVIAKNKIVPYAMGGIVNKPTLFPMANGAGLMGEAGPEAIMPLRRGANGKLGVEASGGAMGNITVNVDAAGSSVEGDASQANQLGKAIGIAVQQELVKQKRPGGLLAS
jgi:lambda family phage tail tape measure protein